MNAIANKKDKFDESFLDFNFNISRIRKNVFGGLTSPIGRLFIGTQMKVRMY